MRVFSSLIATAVLCGLTSGFTKVYAAEPAKKMYRCGNLIQERPCEGPKAAPVVEKVEAPKQGPSQATLESRKKIRCENYDRQITELRDKETAEKNADLRKGFINQRLALQSRMKNDDC